jgi:hypothetical protein
VVNVKRRNTMREQKDVVEHIRDEENDFYSDVDACAHKSALLTSLQSLVDARNDFAHGGSPPVSIGDVLQYFAHGRELMEMLDAVVV